MLQNVGEDLGVSEGAAAGGDRAGGPGYFSGWELGGPGLCWPLRLLEGVP